MRALDTNVLVRLLARDDAAQVATAEKLLEEPFLILPTVLLETSWVLESRFQFSPAEITDRLDQLIGQDNAVVLSSEAVFWALDRYAHGGGFADMLHIALANEVEAERFATFDRTIRRRDTANLSIELETLS